jgi:AraC family transcriptional regulator, positive regulator of tynA and feaB
MADNNDDRPGNKDRLAPKVVNDWKRRIGISHTVSGGPEPIRVSGVEGMALYGQHVRLGVDEPDKFDALMYVRRLSLLGTFCGLHTPMRVERDENLIVEQPSDDVIIGVHTLRGRTYVKQGTRDYAYRPGQLVIVSNAVPYLETTHTVADPAGLVIPLELLGSERHTAEHARRPVASHTLLSRATAAFIKQFSADTAAGGATEPNQETEMAAIQLVRAALGQLNYDNHHLRDNELFVRQAAIDLIERNHRNPEFSPESICRALHISRRQLYRHFENTDESLASLIAESRLKTAHDMLLTHPDLSVTEVAAASGFPSVATMRNRFHARFNTTPNDLRGSQSSNRSAAASHE